MKGFKQGAQTGAGVASHGAAMGFKHGGQVKKMGDGTMKVKKTGNPSDTGVQPARKGRNQAEIEAGGTKRMLPGYGKGGKAMKKGGKKRAGKATRRGNK